MITRHAINMFFIYTLAGFLLLPSSLRQGRDYAYEELFDPEFWGEYHNVEINNADVRPTDDGNIPRIEIRSDYVVHRPVEMLWRGSRLHCKNEDGGVYYVGQTVPDFAVRPAGYYGFPGGPPEGFEPSDKQGSGLWSYVGPLPKINQLCQIRIDTIMVPQNATTVRKHLLARSLWFELKVE